MFERISEVQAGLPEGTVKRFIGELKKRRVCLHSLMLIKSGNVFAEEYAPGFDENFRHRLYSVSKTYVSAAVGVAVGEGFFTLESKVADFFPDKCPENIHPYLRKLTVRDCLMMTTVFNETPYRHQHSDWLKDFFTDTPTHRGGTIFHYDTGASLVLDAIVERTTGQHFNEYLFDKVLKHIGYKSVPPCVESPEGTKWGGSGIQATTEEFAAFAKLIMNDGIDENGCELIPSWYVKEAKEKQTGNAEDNTQNYLRGYGYGYQIWCLKDGWAMFGMGNQLALCFPEADILFICTGDDQGNDFARNYIIEFLYGFILCPLGLKDKEAMGNGLSIPLPMGDTYSPLQDKFSGRTYRLQPSKTGIENISFVFGDDVCEMNFTARNEKKQIRFSLKNYVKGEFPEKNYSGDRINTPMGRGYRCFAAARWDLPDLLVLKCYASDMYFGVMTVNIRFSENGIDMHFTKTAEWFFEEYCGFVTGDLIQ